MALVSRDPFARLETHKERVAVEGQTCSWCGNVKITPKSGKKYLFSFWLESDSGRKSPIGGLFCSNGCRKAFHE